MKAITIIIFLCVFNMFCFSQTPYWEWVMSGGGNDKEFAVSTASDPFGNTYLTGYFASPSITFGSITLNNNSVFGTFDIFLIKYDVNGKVIWGKSFGGTDSEYAEGVCTDIYGNIYVVGEFSSNNFQIDGNLYYYNGGKDVYLAKLDSSGKYQWGAVVGGTGDDYCKGVVVDTLFQNELVYIAGYYDSDTLLFDWYNYTFNNSSANDIFIVNYYAGILNNYLPGGGSNDDLIESIDLDKNGNIYVSGEFNSTDFNFGGKSLSTSGSNDAFTIKVAPYLTSSLWAKSIGGSGNDISEGLSVADNGEVYVSGYYSNSLSVNNQILTSNGNRDILLVKYDSSGNEVWGKSWGGTSYDGAESIVVDAYNNVYLAGYFQTTNLSIGNFSMANQGLNDIFLMKLDSGGNELWALSEGGSLNDYAFDINADAFGNVYICGSFSSNSIQWDNFTIQNSGSNDAYLAKINDAIATSIIENKLTQKTNDLFYNSITKELTINLNAINPTAVYLINSLGQIYILENDWENSSDNYRSIIKTYNLSYLNLSRGVYHVLFPGKDKISSSIYID